MNKAFLLAQAYPLIIAGSIILSTLIASYTFYSSRGFDNTLSVTGSTKERVTADIAKWSVRTERIVMPEDVATGYAQVAADTKRVVDYIVKQGITKEDITTSAATSTDYYENVGQVSIRKVSVSQNITTRSSDIEKIEKAAANTQQLATAGVRFSPSAPEYLISNLAELRISLIGKAVVDAQKRATEVTKAIGQRVGSMKSASSGVVQVMPPDSTDVSDYGSYDTSTKDKDVMVSVRAVFFVK